MATWRRRACALHVLPELAAGRPVAQVAADLGYAGPVAFTTMLTQLLGAHRPPSAPRDERATASGARGMLPPRSRAQIRKLPAVQLRNRWVMAASVEVVHGTTTA
ncbi:hypothetical protein [Pseudonocardia yuanmonensis]|uniref:hypothetical protein n=1 Tax=Pseudonocardia yuanmonensis TaxID=1095914 RepID=UPI0031E6E67A